MNLRANARAIVLTVILSAASGHAAEVVFEGTVSLPAAARKNAAAARYAQKAVQPAPPEPPTAIVYLDGTFPPTPAGTQIEVRVEQKSYQFKPALLAVRKGTRVAFPNLDDDYHHVFSYTKGNSFDLGRYRKDEKAGSILFDKTGFVRIGCEIHDHMEAIVLVLDTPHFVRTSPDGQYQLRVPNLAPGRYVLKAWLDPKTPVREFPVEVKEGSVVKADFPPR